MNGGEKRKSCIGEGDLFLTLLFKGKQFEGHCYEI